MNENIYEVSRDEYVGFVSQINPEMRTSKEEQNETEGAKWIKTYSKKTNRLLCAREILEDGNENYYVFEMPLPEERIAPKPVRKVTLETREEVQNFFNALSQIMKEKDNARTV